MNKETSSNFYSSSKHIRSGQKKFLNISQSKRKGDALQSSTSINSPNNYMTQQISPNNHRYQPLNCSVLDSHKSNHSQSDKERMMGFMRQQIQIGAAFYAKKINGVLREQARCINELKGKLQENNRELNAKNKMIMQLKASRQSPKKKLNVTAHEAALHTNFTKKMQETENKIHDLQEKLRQICMAIGQKDKIQAALNAKIQYIEKILLGASAAKISNYHRKIENYVCSREKQLEKLQMRVSSFSSPKKQPIFSQNNQTMQRINSELTQLKNNIINLSNKEFKYQNHQITQIQIEIKNLHKIIHEFQSTHHHHATEINKMICSQMKKTKGTFITRNDSNQDLSVISHRTIHHPLDINTKSQKLEMADPPHKLTRTHTNNLYKNFEQYEDVQSFTDNEDNEQSDMQDYEQNMDEQMNVNEHRLKQIVRLMGVSFPLKVEIDQTGYLKNKADGMYLVDENHDGFYLTELQLEYFTSTGYIEIS